MYEFPAHCRPSLTAILIAAWLGCGLAEAAEPPPERQALTVRILLMDAYLQALTQPPCRLDAAAAATAIDAEVDNEGLRRRMARIPREIDAALKAGEESGIPYRETCRGLAAQFRGARERALAEYRSGPGEAGGAGQ